MEQELESLTVRLVGDAEEYVGMLDDAKKATEETAKEIEGATDEIEKQGDSLVDYAKAAAAALAVYVGAAGLKDLYSTYRVQETAERQLAGALSVTDQNVMTLMEDYKAWTSALQESAGVGDEVSLQLLKQATLMGLTSEQAKRAVKNAATLSSVYGQSAESMIRYTALLEQGQLGRLGMLLGMPMAAGGADETERIAEAQDRLAKMYAYTEQEAKTLDGTINKMNNSLGDLKEILGKVIYDAIEPTAKFLADTAKDVIEWAQKLDPAFHAAAIGATVFATAFIGLNYVWPIFIKGVGMALGVLKGFLIALATSPITYWIIGITAATAAIVLITQSLSGASAATKDLNKSMEEGARLHGLLSKNYDKITEGIKKQAAAISDPTSRKSFLNEQLELAQKNLVGLTGAAKNATKEFDEQNFRRNRWRETLGIGNTLEPARQQMNEAKKNLEKMRERVQALQQEINAIKLPWEDPTLLKAADDLVKKMELQAATLGMSAEQAELYKLKLAGLRDIDLGKVTEGLAALEAAQLADKNRGDVRRILGGLSDQISALSSTKEELLLYSLEVANAADWERKLAKAMMSTVSGIERRNELLEEGKSITEQFLSPAERYTKRVEQLQAVLDAGGISQDTFNLAVIDAQKQLELAANGMARVTSEIQKFDAALAGSAESNARMYAFKELIAEQAKASRDTFATGEVKNIASGTVKVAVNNPQAKEGVKTLEKKIDTSNVWLKKIADGATGALTVANL